MRDGKSILVFNGGPIFPLGGMNQVRIYNQIVRLSKDHEVDCMFLYSKEHTKRLTQTNLNPYCNRIMPVKTFSQGIFWRIGKRIVLNWLFDRISYPLDYFSASNEFTSKTISRKVSAIPYDIVISHYWQASGFLKYLPPGIFRCIDTHYLVEENLALYRKGMYRHIENDRLGKLLERELYIQNNCFDYADLLIVNSQIQKNILGNNVSRNVICIPNGQELEPYLKYQRNDDRNDKYLLFYGALSNQFNQKGLRRLIEKILPGVKIKCPDIKLIVMGSSPPEWLINMAKMNPDIEVTGFVEDVRPVFARCFVSVIPLESGSGFRGRSVELLASGVPIIGTTNALQSVQINHGINGFVADTDDDIIHYVVRLAEDKELRKRISVAGREFVRTHYSLAATFGVLSNYLQKRKIN
jgi:glycosyltransferase involved in cell wall biosynthesis